MTDETDQTTETDAAAPSPEVTAEPVVAPSPEPAPETATAPEPAPAPESPLHALVDDFHALLNRVEGLEHNIKAELVTGLEDIVAKLKAAI